MTSDTATAPQDSPPTAPPAGRPLPFARIFETDDFGQILVTLGQTDDGAPEVRWTIQPPGLAPCAVGVSFVDAEDGEAQARAQFEAMDEAGARRGAESLLSSLAELRLLAEPISHEIG